MLYHVLFESHDAIRALSDQGQSRDRMQEVFVCRFCHSEEASEASLITPCECKGSMRYVHSECLSNWRKTSEKARDNCSLCGDVYRTDKWDRSNFSREISIVILCLWLYGIDAYAVLFDVSHEDGLFTLIQMTILRVFVALILGYDIFYPHQMSQYVNIDALHRLGLLSLVFVCLRHAYGLSSLAKLDRVDTFYTFYEITRFVVKRMLGDPRIIVKK